ncbi:MAG: acetyl esterase/lipase [Planctomycetota bacterium]
MFREVSLTYGTQILNRTSSNAVYLKTVDVAYGDGDRRRLDVYRPSSGGPKPDPVIVFFYGGGWRKGSRSDYEFVASSIEGFGGDPERIFIAGHSAGAHLAAMVTLDPRG